MNGVALGQPSLRKRSGYKSNITPHKANRNMGARLMTIKDWLDFIKRSYSYVHPNGIWQHLDFVSKLPKASWGYRRWIIECNQSIE